MKSIGKVVAYFRDLLNYYIGGAKDSVRRFGRGVALLHASSTLVGLLEFKNLLAGYSEDGKTKLVQNAGASNQQIGWDLHMAPPKPVSVIWALSPPQFQKEIEKLHHESVDVVLRYIEDHLAFTRRGSAGRILEQARGIFVTIFTHPASRANEPQLHSHAFLHRLAFRKDGSIGSLETLEIYRAAVLLGAMYRAHFAAGLRRMGFEIIPEKFGFHIVGVPRELCSMWSSRYREIRAYMATNGFEGGKAAKIAALATRPDKQEIPKDALFAHWREVAKSKGFGPEEVQKLIDQAQERASSKAYVTSHAKDTNDSRRTEGESNKHSKKQATTSKAPRPTKLERKREALFGEAVERAVNKLFYENRKTSRVSMIASHLAIQHGVGAKALRQAVEKHATDNKRFVRMEWKRLVPKAPRWSPVRKLKLPVVKVGKGKQFRHWDRIRYRQDLLIAEFRIQNRVLFPKAPAWSPLSKIHIPAVRITEKSPALKPKWGEVVRSKTVGPLEVRVHRVALFPSAKKGSLASKANLRAIKIVRADENQNRKHDKSH